MTAEAIKSSPRWQGYTTTGKMLDADPKMLEPDKPLIVNCHGHVEQGLCADCAADFGRVLADVPELLDDLDIAIAGEAKFVEHGTIAGTVEAPGPSCHPAIAAHHRLALSLLGDGTGAHPGASDWFDVRAPAQIARHLQLLLPRLLTENRLPQLARDISSAAARAHHVIDAPKDLVYYGPCPDCGRDITQERIHRDDDKTPVKCRWLSCGYSQPLDVHQKRILDANLDRQFGVTECVSMITNAGQPVTRDQINGWIRHKGLPREWTERPTWNGGSIAMVGMWTLKLRDVVDFMEKKNQEKTVS